MSLNSDSDSHSENEEEEAVDYLDKNFAGPQLGPIQPDSSYNVECSSIAGRKTGNNSFLSCVKSIRVVLLIIALIVVVVAMALHNNHQYSETCSFKAFKALKPMFNKQKNDLWANVRSSLDETHSDVKTLVLLHAKEDAATADCLAKKIASAFTCSPNSRPNYFTPGQINGFESFGKFLEGNRETLGKAVVFKDLTLIDKDKVQIFHTICDDISPYIKPALYIFTFAAPNSSEVPHFLARRILEMKWRHLDHNILDPLINRVLGFVTFVEMEDQLPCSSSEIDQADEQL